MGAPIVVKKTHKDFAQKTFKSRWRRTAVLGRGRSCLFRPKANLPARLYESYILHYLLLERDGCTDWCVGSVGPLHQPVLPAACLPVKKTYLPFHLIVAFPHCVPTNLSGNVRLQDIFATSSPSSAGFTLYRRCLLRVIVLCHIVKVDKAIKMAPYGRAGSELPMPCTVPRLPGLIHCVQLLTLLLPLAQWSDYNKAPLCRMPVIIPYLPFHLVVALSTPYTIQTF